MGTKKKPSGQMENILGPKLQGKSGDIDTKTLNECDLVGIYFSAHWCPPCKAFTPKLASWYKQQKQAGKKVEIVFVSSDQNQTEFDHHFGEMPWLSCKYSDSKGRASLKKTFGVSGIPQLTFLHPATMTYTQTFSIWSYTNDGRGFIGSNDFDTIVAAAKNGTRVLP